MRDFAFIQTTPPDLIVIGGGINGAGVARDAALRGLNTLLLEKADFGSGTTSRPTRLIHGGLRYLEYFEFNLVRESLRERERLFHNAPHLVKPLQMTIPIYADRRSYRLIQAGMVLYDLLSWDKTLPNHRMLSAPQTRHLFPDLNPTGLKGAAQYYDAQVIQSERLCLETILAAQAAGATCLNYAPVTQLQRSATHITALTGIDPLTGTEFTVPAGEQTIVVNTTGPWVDRVLGLSSAPISTTPCMGGTQGSHIFVDPFVGAPSTALYLEASRDRRPFFIIPWLNLYLIGTTDLPFAGDLDHVKAHPDEIDYLLAATNQAFPSAHLTRQDIRFTYAGVRPLPYTQDQTPGSITRQHIIRDHHRDGVDNLLSLIGGKLTTYRQAAEDLVNAVYRKLQRPSPPCSTAQLPLPGACSRDDPHRQHVMDHDSSGLSRITRHHLCQRYGARAPQVLAISDQTADLAQPIMPGLPDIKAELVYAVQAEQAHTLLDFCCRRTTLAMQTHYGDDILPTLTQILIQYCGWTQGDCDRQVQAYQESVDTHYRF